MEKDKIFFSEDGLTSTSANYVANLCKESYKALEQELNSVVFYTTTVKLLNSSEVNTLREGVDSTMVSSIKEKLETIAKLKSLIAWLREALKAKERLIQEAKKSSYSDYGIECPDAPERQNDLTEDEVIATWNIKQRNRYYYLDTLCAVIGSYIHPGQVFATQRDELQKIIHEPNTISGSGRDTLLYHKEPSVPDFMVENTFMQLQNEYRNYQAELNSMKHQIETAIVQDRSYKDTLFNEQYKAYNNEMKALDVTLKEKVHEATVKAQNLKIIIPDHLKPVYEQVQKLGK